MLQQPRQTSSIKLHIYILVILGVLMVLGFWQPIWLVPPLMAYTPLMYVGLVFLCLPGIAIYGYLKRFSWIGIGSAVVVGVIAVSIWLMALAPRSIEFLWWNNYYHKLRCSYFDTLPEYSCERKERTCAEGCATILNYDFKKIGVLPFAILINKEEMEGNW